MIVKRQAGIIRKFLQYLKTSTVETDPAPKDLNQNKKGAFRRRNDN